jgi:hypothetical protein
MKKNHTFIYATTEETFSSDYLKWNYNIGISHTLKHVLLTNVV